MEQPRTPTDMWAYRRRYACMQHYSTQDEPVCACCGESIFAFLCIDHIDGCPEGYKRPRHIYNFLTKAGFPPGYQVLCYNCNNAKHTQGVCPHQLIDREVVENA